MGPNVGVAVLVTRGDRLLLVKRQGSHGAGTWSTPGGHIDFGESPDAAGIREVEEETGLRVVNLTFRAITNDLFSDVGKHYITIWFDAGEVSGEAVNNAPYESSEIGWFAWDGLPGPLFLPLVNLLAGQSYPPRTF